MRILLAAVCLCACAHGAAVPDTELANWRSQHPVAAKQLCSFAWDSSETSRMRRWMHDHPTQAAELLDWASQNPDAAQDLASTHSGVAGAIDGRNC